MRPTPRVLGLIVVGFVFSALRGAPAEVTLDLGWRFLRGDPAGAEAPDFDDRTWRVVDLPHDWSIEDLPEGAPVIGAHDRTAPDGSDVGYTRGGIGWYRRVLAEAERPAGAGLELVVQGAQQEADIWVNGTHVAFQPHGYVPARLEIGPLLRPRPAPNVIAIRVSNPERNSRWYSGSGLYRGVTLRGHDTGYIPLWGVRFDTAWLHDDRAGVEVSVEIRNALAIAQDTTVSLELTAPDGTTTHHDLGEVRLPPANGERLRARLWLSHVQPWSPEQPRLYTGHVRVRQGSRVIDESSVRFGVRTVVADAVHGLRINGEPLKLRGGCVHHDNGLLGARAFPEAERRRVRLLKESGYNAIRTAHNPPSIAFLEACDELGMLVIDEFTDCWEVPKKLNGYQRYFAVHAEHDLTEMLRRDFNHPAVIGWSIGNEIPERFTAAGGEIAARLASVVRREDPRRPITAAINWIWEEPALGGRWDANDPAFRSLDIGGYNYAWDQYELDHARYPQRVMCGTESYPLEAWENWSAVERLPYVIGDFVWTAMDHLGECGIGHTGYVDASAVIRKQQDASHSPWPVWVNWSGDLDLIGDKKPQSFYRDVVWRRSPVELLVHEPVPAGKKEKVGSWGWPAEVPSWNWAGQEGRPLTVSVYSRAQRVRLALNGRVMGEQTVDPTNGITARFTVPWQPGTLTATALDGDRVVGTKELRTTGAPVQLRLEPEPSRSEGRNTLVFVPISVLDATGARVPDAAVPLTVTVEGEAELCALGSANPRAVDSLSDATTATFRGRALAILRSTGRAGTARVRVATPGLPPATAEVTVRPE